MRMKNHFWIAMALLSLGVTSCKDDITFDQETYDQLVDAAFPVQNVDPTHQWATVGVANTIINVNTGTKDVYQVKIYEQNPIGYQGTLKLLGEGRITDGDALKMKISYQLAQPWAYVTLFDSQNYMSVYPALIKDGVLNVDVNNAKTPNASRRAGLEPKWKFSGMPADEDFATSLPDNYVTDANANGGGQGVNIVIQSSYIGYLNLWNAGSNIYFPAGNWTVGGQNVGANSHVYLLPGAHVTFNGEYNLNSTNATMHIAQGATFNANSISYNFNLYNRGEITTQMMTQYAQGTLVNEGTVTIEQNLKIANNMSEVINAGTLTAASMSVEGSGHFQNLGTMTLSGETTVNSNNCTWVNDGTYTTGSFVYTAGSTDVINNCKLTCTDKFRINLGDTKENGFQMNGGASVITKNFEFEGPGYIKMGSNSLFHVTESAKFYIANDGYGIYGPDTGAEAVFQAKKIERLRSWETNQGFTANYFGHLYVATDDHFNFGYSDKSEEQQKAGEIGTHPYYRLDAASGAKMVPYNGAKAELSDAGCGAAYIGKPDEGGREETPMSYRYCFEDNFPDVGDYDFNDVVLTVTPTLDDKTLTIKVSLDAVGATKTLGAAIRLIGVKSEDLDRYEVTKAFPTVDGNGQGDYHNIEHSDGFVLEGQEPNLTDNMVIVLFRDAHWAINPQTLSDGSVEHIFFNTVKKGDYYERDVTPPTATYTLVFKDAAKAKEMLATKLYDVFIVIPYNGSYWEVHTVQFGFKTAQVITTRKPEPGYSTAYGSNMPWAIMAPGDFKYPYEWQVIGNNKDGEIIGAYKESGHSFAEWAENSDDATDWYKYPTAGLVYEK
jgi:LruC domain-containing protein